MQMLCSELGNQFNLFNTPKKIDFLCAWVLEIPRDPLVFYGLESFIGKSMGGNLDEPSF